jgi:hypothetical protein
VNEELLASRFHGALAGGHLFAAYYNFRKRNWIDLAIHCAFLVYDVSSAISHNRDAKEQGNGRWTEDVTG